MVLFFKITPVFASCSNFAVENLPVTGSPYLVKNFLRLTNFNCLNLTNRSIIALALIILIPVGSYFLVKNLSADAIEMPRRYYPDSVVTSIVDGKQKNDTLWHKLANITLTNQLGKQVSLYDIKGKIIVANFFFTRLSAPR
jgi:hypothetical protein